MTRPAWLKIWLVWLSGAIGVLIIAAVLFAWRCSAWMDDQGDLMRIDAQARSIAVPVAWSEMGLHADAAARIGMWGKIVTAAKRLPAWKDDPKHPTLVTGLPPPLSLIGHHAAFDPLAVTTLLGLIDGLGSEPLILRSENMPSTKLPEIATYREVTTLLGQRVLLAPREQLWHECRRMLDFITIYHADSTLPYLVKISLVSIALRQMTRRLPELKEMPERAAWSARVLDLASRIPDDGIQARQGDFIMFRSFLGNLRDADLATMGSGGKRTISWYGHLWEMAVLRMGREESLAGLLKHLEFLQRHPAAAALMAEDRRIDAQLEEAKGQGRSSAITIISNLITSGQLMLARWSRSTMLQAQLLVAEANGAPWPIDDFDPAGNRLQRIDADGRLIGASSVEWESDGESHVSWDLYGSLRQWQKQQRR